LHRLASDARLLWSNRDARRQALLDLLAGWDRGGGVALQQVSGRIDRAVAAGLAAFRLPRDSGATYEIGHFGRGWIGHVTDDLKVQFDVEQVRYYVRTEQQPDRIFHTWVHESLHARAVPSAPRSVSSMWRGYEEGMVEGLARTIATAAGLLVTDPSYGYYVEAYRALSSAGGFEAEHLWRALWRVPPGNVREHFAAVVNAVHRECGNPARMAPRPSQLRKVGDRVFAWGNAGNRADPPLLTRYWESAFR
jgi:hypothetical protein